MSLTNNYNKGDYNRDGEEISVLGNNISKINKFFNIQINNKFSHGLFNRIIS